MAFDKDELLSTTSPRVLASKEKLYRKWRLVKEIVRQQWAKDLCLYVGWPKGFARFLSPDEDMRNEGLALFLKDLKIFDQLKSSTDAPSLVERSCFQWMSVQQIAKCLKLEGNKLSDR